jgi:hypothetical protein
MWQIQARLKNPTGREWEPITVERARPLGGAYERQYHYGDLDQARRAFAEYVEIEGSLANFVVRQATGMPRFTDLYDVRFVYTSEPGLVWDPAALDKSAIDTSPKALR